MLKQANLAKQPDVDQLATAMLNVDNELHSSLAIRRTLSVLDDERNAGRQLSKELLRQGAVAGAWGGLPELVKALCAKADDQSPDAHDDEHHVPNLTMRASLITAFGAAGQLQHAFAEHDSLSERRGRWPASPQCGVALLKACVACGELDRAFEVFEDLKKDSSRFEVGPAALTTLIRGCTQQGDAERAEQILEYSESLGIDVRAAAVREFARARHSPRLRAQAQRLHREVVGSGARMPAASTLRLAQACLQAGEADESAAVLGVQDAENGGRDGDVEAALDSLFALNRKEEQWNQAMADVRRG